MSEQKKLTRKKIMHSINNLFSTETIFETEKILIHNRKIQRISPDSGGVACAVSTGKSEYRSGFV